jgi:ferredoxin-type protein NapG
MAEPVDRRAFFSLGFRKVLGKAVDVVSAKVGGGEHIRPPGALPEAAFLAACTRCGACEPACPVRAIRPLAASAGLAAGTPALQVATQACVMCVDMPCAAACPTSALEVPAELWRGVKLSRIAIDANQCIAFRDVECGVCVRVCPAGEEALRLDANGRPVIGPACTGCGACINGCVTSPSSITARPLEMMR